jgi:hypothetical protein
MYCQYWELIALKLEQALIQLLAKSGLSKTTERIMK